MIYATKHKIEKLCYIWDKVFKNRPSKICGRQPLKNWKGYGLLKQTTTKQQQQQQQQQNL